MLIGNNTNFNNNDALFNNKLRTIKENNNNNTNSFNSYSNNKYTNINNGDEVLNKSFSILQDRLNNGLITLEEFNKKCSQLNKQRQK